MLHKYSETEKDLKNYIHTYPAGLWIHEAYMKLAELQFLLKNPTAAIETYSNYLNHSQATRSSTRPSTIWPISRDSNSTTAELQSNATINSSRTSRRADI
ncbi:MAG: hypothetical protein A2487_13645 [Candidatus Raymondbacteria bacterium RifOxyC12_full_50_8]|uniref:Outer membrane lipoprotein BamD-like domain-containing protein n=1 Tax=Candidatus Raymondbacteria bacterium RIFOXYD12_FULL_49_13 TaxID=1817890 RepID=A0A1F7F6A7_UNCRA|nr:MAG: hypothetical protein A2487_13645 [Candidatus Raymondbacteria bacterium RifOxyC12_full_50_8]OGK02171.1 MAG: hypothetical protein A2519_19045 [Candidatus Raymondbacteria bacterium RIFOXYD12_FULL_49_13]OGK03597.1 MAG: hypothetical protein A2350_01580 [Candidatus Raymondbacteria bacterium RifOxyB12_full_50_8]